jgi:GT2 family glycosyltransferase
MNRFGDLVQLLDSLETQTCKGFEVVFVGEKDPDICTRVTRYAQEHTRLELRNVFNEGLPGLSPARNLGVRHARGEVIAFVDDDAVVAPTWVEALLRRFEKAPEAIGVTGPAYPLWEDEDSMSWFPPEFRWIVSCSTDERADQATIRVVRNAWGVNMAFRREAFDLCGFSETFVGGNHGALISTKGGLLGDDTEFCLRLHQHTDRPILFDPAVTVRHKVPANRLTVDAIRRRAFWEGYTKATLVGAGLLKRDKASSMGDEHLLLRRILFAYFPRETARLLTQPRLALRRLFLGTNALFHLTLGYLSVKLARFGGARLARRYRS